MTIDPMANVKNRVEAVEAQDGLQRIEAYLQSFIEAYKDPQNHVSSDNTPTMPWVSYGPISERAMQAPPLLILPPPPPPCLSLAIGGLRSSYFSSACRTRAAVYSQCRYGCPSRCKELCALTPSRRSGPHRLYKTCQSSLTQPRARTPSLPFGLPSSPCIPMLWATCMGVAPRLFSTYAPPFRYR